jgi:hypothetical protein
MASRTEICNLALSHLGEGKEIANFTSERSQQAESCRRFFDIALACVLRDFAWPFASKVGALSLISQHPNTEWGYAYRYPTDCLDVRRILSGFRNETHQSRVGYRIGQDDGGLVIYTDQPRAWLEYTVRAEDSTRYPPDFVMALSFRLAAYIAPRVTGGDAFKMGDRALQLYGWELSKAMAGSANEEQADLEADSEFIRIRE